MAVSKTTAAAVPEAEQNGSKPSDVARSKRATFDRLAKKRRATRELTFNLNDDGDDPEEVTMLFEAIGARAYDDLIAKYPPNAKQKLDNFSYDIDKFAPALIAKCSVEPKLSYEECLALWQSEDWSRGELMMIFQSCVELNLKGMNVPFIGTA